MIVVSSLTGRTRSAATRWPRFPRLTRPGSASTWSASISRRRSPRKPAVRTLLRAVTRFGGRYFNAATSRELDAASRAIDSIEKGVLVSRTLERDAPVFQWFALPSLICLTLGFALRAVPALIDQT